MDASSASQHPLKKLQNLLRNRWFELVFNEFMLATYQLMPLLGGTDPSMFVSNAPEDG